MQLDGGEIYTIDSASEALEISRECVGNAIMSGVLRHVVFPDGACVTYRIRGSWLQSWLDACAEGGRTRGRAVVPVVHRDMLSAESSELPVSDSKD